MKFLNDKQISSIKGYGWDIKYPNRLGFKFTGSSSLSIELPSRVRSGIYDIGHLGAYSYLGDGEYNAIKSIGRYCSIAGGQKWGLYEHYLEAFTSSPIFQRGFWHNQEHTSFYDRNASQLDVIAGAERNINSNFITIGNDVWVGDGVFIKKGVEVGDGAVIAARSVIVKDVPPYTIVGGVPAKVIKKRFDDNIIEQLLELQWWDYDMSILDGLDLRDIQNCITVVRDRLAKGAEKVNYETISIDSELNMALIG